MKRCLHRLCTWVLLCTLLAAALSAPAAAASSTGFSDVPASHWAADEIRRAGELRLFQGDSRGRFGLGSSMTRGAFAVVLCRMFGWEMTNPEAGSYTDNQDPSAWYYSAVETAYAHGAVTDQTDAFRPHDAITREEIAVMLVRAMGFGTIAGLAQELTMPFTDVRTNTGYIAMAYTLGVVSGTSDTTFSPDKTATREQAAVMLMRVYDKYFGTKPEVLGIAASAEGLTDLSGYSAVAVAAQRLIYGGQVRLLSQMTEEEITAVRAAAQAAGAAQLLYVSGTETALKGTAGTTASLLADAVDAGGYDGLFLDLTGLGLKYMRSFTSLAESLDTALGDKLLYLGAEGLTWEGDAYNGYEYAALAKEADKLVVRVPAAREETGESFTVAPPEPLEEVYYALTRLKGQVDGSKLCLLLTTTGTVWTGDDQEGTLSAAQIQELRQSLFTEEYYSSRYACPYLTYASGETLRVVWYLDGEAAAQRARMAAFFGAESVCLSDLGSVADWEGYNLLEQLT